MRHLLIWLATAIPAHADLQFEDRSAGLVPHIYDGAWEHFVGGGVAVFDCNGDALPDIFAAGGANPSRLMINQGDFKFSVGGAFGTGVTGAYPLDIDGDGVLDLAVLRVGANRLLKGDGACGFSDASNAWGFDGRDRWTTAFAAYWTSGQPTLIFGNYVNRDDPEGPFGACDSHSVHSPTSNGFGLSLIKPGYCTLSMLVSDWTRQGVLTLRISNDRHYHQDKGHEQMLALPALTPLPGWPEKKLWGMGIASADITGDGLPEVMLSSMGDQLLQFNTGAGFEDAPYGTGTFATRPHTGGDTRPSTGWHTAIADFDNDGLRDIFIAKGNVDAMSEAAGADPNNLLQQQPDGTFVEAAASAGIATMERSRGAGIADFDGDGRLDLVVVNRAAQMEIHRNVSDGTGNWLGVELSDRGGNTFAVGAWIDVRSAARQWSHEATVGGGHASGQATPAHFGLGPADAVEVRVTWPDGEIGDWQAYDVNQVIQIAR